MELMANYSTFLKVIWQIGINECILMVPNLDGGIVESGAPYLIPLLFFIYIIDLENGIKSHITYFADDTSLFTIVKEPDISAHEINHDLHQISQWAYRWKLSFNLDPTNQAVQVVFTRKCKQIDHPKIYFNDIEV